MGLPHLGFNKPILWCCVAGLFACAGSGVGMAVRDYQARHAPITIERLAVSDAFEPLRIPKLECPKTEAVDPPWMGVAPMAPATAPETPPSLERRVAFWTRVWGEQPENTHLLVDMRRPWIVHAEIDCRDLYATSDAEQAKFACGGRISQARKDVQRRLKASWQSPKVLAMFDGSRALARKAHESLMGIQGRKDALTRAKDRASQHLGHSEGLFALEDVPRIYARAAFVESLWRPEALSRTGAAGAYQFMPRTGAQYLKVEDGAVDERLDPLRSSWAAAQYMSDMKRQLSSWPLVLTAYNTGPARLKRLMEVRKTKDLGKLADAGDYGEFGFDGQNYYAQIAAIGRLTVDAPFEPVPITGRAVKTQAPMSFLLLAACNEADPAVLKAANPALSEAVVTGQLPVPSGYVAYLPDDRAQAAFGFDPRKTTRAD